MIDAPARADTQVRPYAIVAAGPVVQGRDAGQGQAMPLLDIDGILARLEEWMRVDVGDGRASPLTLATYRSDVRQHLGWLAERWVAPLQVTPEVLKEFRAELVGMYQVSTVGRKLASVRRFYQLAHGHGALPSNPALGLRAPADRTGQATRTKYLTLEQLRALLAATDTAREPAAQVRDRAILALMGIHGLRVCEVSRLDVGDVALDAGEAGELTVVGKGAKRRTVLLTEDTRLCVEKWIAVRQLIHRTSSNGAGAPAAEGQEALFLSLSGAAERIGTRGLRAMVDGYLRKIGAKRAGVSCHALRHTYATQSLALGASLLAISGSLGHSNVTTTQVYAQIVDRARNNPAKFLVGALGVDGRAHSRSG